ncbi:phosphotransferase enzyme family protein [Myceligenerans pegani]|uniref:Aminoglycoside phosphotransferase family protein n=1 Tax=Myceligenerans pegani TaxID=2776917 RepID=A0ABR9MWG3_9MICO|nr:aminoglycoside phosphotransferase family protein [Myceligenerans sp. TRM 65318]MBE1875734.1 aminoglycoside phosphotransferase family protein [Myceligenerans sp. TRM 65318]MBE3018005.1 aminoglycoside phosphotransferase family protein [Myceligenerans sp. TRM 65318]
MSTNSTATPTTEHIPGDTDWPYAVLAATCERIGASPEDARLIKFTNNAVFALARDPFVVRIAGSSAIEKRVNKVVSVANWLARHDMPTVRLVEGIEQPMTVDGRLVTVWHKVADVGPQPTGHDLGRIAKRFHALPDAPGSLPKWDQLHSTRTRLATQDVLTGDEHDFLAQTADELEAELAEVDYLLEPGPIHGDVFAGNLIPGPDWPVLCDFDSTCHGPREWDLTPAAVGRLRFHYPVDYHGQLAEAYGLDITTWPGFTVFRRIRELQLVCSVLPVLRSSPRIRDQWRHRFETFRDGDLDAVWTTYT